MPQPPHDALDPPDGSSPPPVLAEVVRSGIVEARHRGSLVLLAPDGSVELALGDVDAVVLPRSSVKPLQAAGMVRAGLRLPPEQLALACASHSGEPRHAALCRDVLHEAGLDEDALGCPPSLPLGEAALEAWVREGGRPDRVHHNCSGKHAAMLATCVSCGWPVGGYLDPAHPLQARLRETVEELSGEPVGAVAVDGCGAPAFGMSLPGLARAFARIATGEPEVAGAMRAHPGVVGGVGRDVSELMAAVDGLVAKEGAEGAYAAALPDGRAMALKIDDGAKRPLPGLLAAVLERWGRGGATVERWRETAVLGGGAPVGSVRVAAALG